MKKNIVQMMIGISALAIMGGTVQAANIPAWWHTRGLVNTNLVSNDYAPANIGQLKNVAYQTWMEVTNQLAQVSGINRSLYVNGAGQVGIGTTNPAGQLHVQKAIGFSGVAFTGSGLNDLSVNYSGYTGSGDTRYIVKVRNSGPTPNKIEYSADNGVTWSGEINIVNGLNIGQGVTISFGAFGGHTYDDQWAWTISQGFADTLVVGDDKVGIGTTTPSAKLHVMGGLVVGTGTATGMYAVAEGFGTTASGDCSHAEGSNTIASGFASHAEGGKEPWEYYYRTTASGDYSHAEGVGTAASGLGSHAEGVLSVASGCASHAEGGILQISGGGNIASGWASHAEGIVTRASGHASHAEGEWTTASGHASHFGMVRQRPM